jgi:hypothetical protein
MESLQSAKTLAIQDLNTFISTQRGCPKSRFEKREESLLKFDFHPDDVRNYKRELQTSHST